VQISLL